MSAVYTIGHSRHPWDRFLALLQRHEIERVIDARSRPFSRFCPHFNRERLKAALDAAGIVYEWRGGALGGRPEDPRFLRPDGALDRDALWSWDALQSDLDAVATRAGAERQALLCAEEVDRACAPWGLLAEDKQATLVAGIEIAVDLAPLSDDTRARYALSGGIQARLRKEAYVLHARRYLVDGGPIHPRQRQVIDELSAFKRPYLRRLWARLHGRDVWQESCDDVDDLRGLLEGVARSVSLDHRQRIKSMLELRPYEVVQ